MTFELEHWDARLYGSMCFCLESGGLPAYKESLGLKMLKPDPKMRSTAKQYSAAQELKKATKNIAELVYLMFSDEENYDLDVLIVSFVSVVKDYHTFHNLSCRSPDGTLKWAYLQCVGGFRQHLSKLCQLLRDSGLLKKIGLVRTHADIDDISHPMVASQNKLATCGGNLVIGLMLS